jgi:hypothetical protein
MIRKKKLKVPLYGARMELISCKNGIEVEDSYKLESGLLATMDAGVVTIDDHETNMTTFLLFIEEKAVSPGLIAHEAYRLASKIFQHINAKSEYDNQEPLAYLIEWIVGECHKFYKVKG